MFCSLFHSEPPTVPAVPPGPAEGGSGIQFRYREDGGSTWTELMADHNITLTVDTDYEFECTIVAISPVDPLPGGQTGCTHGNGIQSLELDVVDIDFIINRNNADVDVVNAGVGDGAGDGNDEPATANGNVFNIKDTYMHTPLATDECPTTIRCAAAFDPSGQHLVDADGPFIEINVLRMGEYISVIFLSHFCLPMQYYITINVECSVCLES